eukprot:887326-Prorocentrum_minimum.AAC.3
MFAAELEWTRREGGDGENGGGGGDSVPGGHEALRARLGSPVDVVLACDCIFAPLYGDSFPLLQILEDLADSHTR